LDCIDNSSHHTAVNLLLLCTLCIVDNRKGIGSEHIFIATVSDAVEESAAPRHRKLDD